MSEYFKRFFKEKGLPLTEWEIKAPRTGMLHFIDSDTVIESIMGAAKPTQKKIRNTLTILDLVNGDILGYLYKLAACMVEAWEALR